MSPEFWTAFASVGTLVVIAATAVAAIIQLHHLRGSNQIIALNEFREAFESPELLSARNAAFELTERMEDPAFRRSLERVQTPDWFQRIQYAARLLETLGGYVKHGIVSEEIVCDLWSAPIVTLWTNIGPAIVVMRRTRGPATYENFEMLACLAQRFMSHHPSAYPKDLPRIAPPDKWEQEDARARAATGIAR